MTTPKIIVGVTPRIAEVVAIWALRAARWWDAELAFVTVNPRRYAIGTDADGLVVSKSSYADRVDEAVEVFSQPLRYVISTALGSSDIVWTVSARAGDPAHELAAAADELQAKMIVVGARRSGLTGWLHAVVDGDVAARLTRGPQRPVLVVPRGCFGDSSERDRGQTHRCAASRAPKPV